MMINKDSILNGTIAIERAKVLIICTTKADLASGGTPTKLSWKLI